MVSKNKNTKYENAYAKISGYYKAKVRVITNLILIFALFVRTRNTARVSG